MEPPSFPVEPPDLETTLDAVLDEVARPPDAWTSLRALPTPVRVAVGVLVAVAFAAAVVAVLGPRTDLPQQLSSRFASGLVALGLGAITTAALALRGLHRPPLGRLGLAAGIVIPLLAMATPLIPGFWPGTGDHGLGLGCLAVGTLAAGIGGGALLGLARARALPVEQRALAGVAGGLLGFAMNEVWCAAGDVVHLMVGHASLAVVGAVVVASLGALRK